jgi:hypothetical protein
MYVLIACGVGSMYVRILGMPTDLYLYTQFAGLLALVCGIASIIHWVTLE